ncbi:formylglycine-generating enzyme family protein [Acinetobacter gyllenbergii]|uniref:formylglycine-generating enzyme family protein n=1 Tax=Acinetobacter gyllenbergii TaxID=134534 RepID=UPI0021D15147|nr:formylglycine-generating enzyme family protein [Acinetobacter gyllenbergii]MCU4581514.1 formylglycine-generating enzyme family protein [Acinetobacter gyllenbergii]
METLAKAYAKAAGIVLAGCLLAACNDDDKKKLNSDIKLQTTTMALTALSQHLVWKNDQCDAVYRDAIEQNHKALTALQDLRASLTTQQNNLAAFIDQRMLPKLTQLGSEATFIRERCNAPDYDGTGVSMERPAMLREMLNEWQGTIDLLTKQLSKPPQMNVSIQPARLTNVDVNADTVAAFKFKDCSDGFCPELTVIPAGSYLMGGTLEEQEREGVPAQARPYELPQHQVNVTQPFAMASHETTVAQFQQFQKETGWEVQGCRSWETRDGEFNMWYRNDLTPSNPGFAQTAQDPVVCVRREDGQAFAAWLSEKTGKTYRLPTEAEWEYAARAGTLTAFYWGNDPERDQACKYANVLDVSTTTTETNTATWRAFNCNDGYAYTAPVGSFLPNAFGLYDVLANAREWVDDCWHANYQGAPATAVRWGAENNGLCNFPVLRGGAWIYNVHNVRTAYRNAYYSSQARSTMWGFRVVREI